MRWKNPLKDSGGQTLAEAMAAGMILAVMSLMMVKGLTLSSDLTQRADERKRMLEEVQAAVERDQAPAGMKNGRLSFPTADGEVMRIPVIEKSYGRKGEPRLWKVTRAKP